MQLKYNQQLILQSLVTWLRNNNDTGNLTEIRQYIVKSLIYYHIQLLYTDL